jgi:hypothetical protein
MLVKELIAKLRTFPPDKVVGTFHEIKGTKTRLFWPFRSDEIQLTRVLVDNDGLVRDFSDQKDYEVQRCHQNNREVRVATIGNGKSWGQQKV